MEYRGDRETHEKSGLVWAPDSARKMGFWNALDIDVPPWTRKEVERRIGVMSQREIHACPSYMNHAKACQACMGHANCRLCDRELGCKDMLTPDEKWIFPEKWDHYITVHGVKPDEEFIRDALEWMGKP